MLRKHARSPASTTSTSTIQAALEAINMLEVGGMFWVGGRDQHISRCNPADTDWDCCNSYNPCGHGEGDCDSDNDCAGNLVCGTDNCAAGDHDLDCCTTPAGTTVSMDFVWIGDNSTVDSGNWATGFPVSG